MSDLLRKGLEKGLARLFGTKSERDLKKLQPLVDEMLRQAEEYKSLSDDQLKAKTDEFRQLLANGKTEDDILVEAFAVVKEACRRNFGRTWNVVDRPLTWEMDPFPVQMMGGIVLHQGKISEMATGEGKTLVALFPLYLNALSGKGAHLVTVNDYLARRDSEWVGEILRWLGLTVGVIQHGKNTTERREAYGSDVTYGTNNEFGFDYLRDNMVQRAEEKVQRPHNFAIVDEVDSVLVDEARTPLIISGPVAHANQYYERLRGPVEVLIREQNAIVSRFMDEAEKLITSSDKDEQYQAVVRMLQVQRATPKHKRFLKMVAEDETLKKRMMSVEGDFMREKRVHVLDDDLLFSIDEKGHSVSVSDKGREMLSPKDPKAFILPDLAEDIGRIDQDATLAPEQKLAQKEAVHRAYAEKSEVLGNVQQLLKAYTLYERDGEYVVQEGKVIIVDEFTGRLMPGRRFSDGLHQALEAKERVNIGEENQTLATITIQNYFRMYEKLAGMTGTAETEAGEFWEIYKLDVVVVPTHRPIARIDEDDFVYRTKREKYNAIIEEIEEMNKLGRPVLVGTVSVEVSETISRMLKRKSIEHSVLNAKYHQSEAEIVSLAGQKGAVTIATNMAGRGTDIKLGPGVVWGEATEGTAGVSDKSSLTGGLHIVGTERHESRRIDRQLRGRSGRQGDPGSSRFFLSLEDNLMRLFAPERIAGMMDKLGAKEGEVITHPFMTRAIEQAQKRVEAHNFAIRKHLLEYDDVMNQQRDVIYTMRDQVLEKVDLREKMQEMIANAMQAVLDKHVSPSAHPDVWDLPGLQEELQLYLLTPLDFSGEAQTNYAELQRRALEAAKFAYQQREAVFGQEQMREIERWIYLRVIDEKWRDHLYEVDQLRAGIGLRAYGQKDPLLEYKREAFEMFEELMGLIEADAAKYIFRVMPARVAPPPQQGAIPQGEAAPQGIPSGSTDAPEGVTSSPEGGVPAMTSSASLPMQGQSTSAFGNVQMTSSSASSASQGQAPPRPAPPRPMPPRGPAQPAEALVVGGGASVSRVGPMHESKPDAGGFSGQRAPQQPPQQAAPQPTVVRKDPKVGRNDPCPCGSGKKFKKCHGINVGGDE